MNKLDIKFEPIQNTDIDALCNLLWEADVQKYLCDDEQLPRKVIQTFIDDSLLDKYSRLLMILNQNIPIGIVGVRPVELLLKQQLPENVSVEVTVALSKQYYGKGIAKLAVQKIHHFAKTTLELDNIYSIIDVPNIRSQQLFQSLSYTRIMDIKLENPQQYLFQFELNSTAMV